MNKKATLVGIGLGAALMYFFDPDRGRRRRALVRGKVEAAGNKASDYAEKMGRDIRNRAYGMVAETKAATSTKRTRAARGPRRATTSTRPARKKPRKSGYRA